MKIYEVTVNARKEIHIHVNAETKEQAASNAMKVFQEHGGLVLWESVGGMWTGPEETEFDEEVEVTQALDEGPPYWSEPERIVAQEVEG